MADPYNLTRFLEAQETAYAPALQQVRQGRKTGHWMWYIFPQIKGLGQSETSKFFAITNKAEASAYLHHPVLGRRLIEISAALLNLPSADPVTIFGTIDSLKLQSSMTLFSLVESAPAVFQQVLDKFFGGQQDMATVRRLTA